MKRASASLHAWRRRADRPRVYGHRGARHAAPENTLSAFDLAMDEGADGVELDVRLDGGGRVIVLHDRTLARVTESRDARDVESLDGRDLASVDVGAGECVPSLADVIAWARDRDARVNVEVKHDTARLWPLVHDVARLLRGQSGEQFLLSSFHVGIVAALGHLAPHVPVAWLLHDRQTRLAAAPGRRLVGASAIHPQTTMADKRRLRPWQRDGFVVNVWTVNEPDDARRLDRLGVDGLISDCPGAVLEALRAP
jgi:glycerophosphoryl diester phosphodiesterase